MNSVRLNNLSLKYQRFTPSSVSKYIGITKFEFVAKTQFLLSLDKTPKVVSQFSILENRFIYLENDILQCIYFKKY